MIYEVGDKIVVKITNEDGVVREILGDDMLIVEVRGVEFPTHKNQVEYPYFKMFTQPMKPAAPKKIYVDNIKREKQILKSKTGEGVHLQFLPVYDKDVFEDDVVEKIKLYLINENEEAYAFKYDVAFQGASGFDLEAVIPALSEFYLHDLDFADISDNPRFDFVFELTPPLKKKALYYEAGLKVTGKKIFKRIEELQNEGGASFKYSLFTEYPERQQEERLDLGALRSSGYRIDGSGTGSKHLPPPRSVVDLHIEKITDNVLSLSTSEMLDLQINTFEKYYDLALGHKLKIMIVIHGVGEGILKQELHQILQNKKEVQRYQNTYHELYGYGATEIFFK